MTKAALKVFSGSGFILGIQVRGLVAAASQKAAIEALQAVGMSIGPNAFRSFWTVTGNDADCETALASPGDVFVTSSTSARDYRRVKPKATAATPPKVPKVPKDPEERKKYDADRRAESDKDKKARGERRLTTWLPREAAEALDKLTGGSTERGAVQAALVRALTASAAQMG